MHKALVVCLSAVCTFLVWVAALLPSEARAQADSLENPGAVSAIQDRAYRMQHELDLSVGLLPLDAFYKGLYAQLSYTYHFTDDFAWQVGRGAYVYAAQTSLRQQLVRDFQVDTTRFDQVQFFVGSDLIWKPFYGKTTVMNKTVLHGEAFFLLGPTLFKFTNAFRPGVNLGGGIRLFASKVVSFRLDITDTLVLPIAGTLDNVMTITLSLAVNFGSTE